MKDIEEFNNYLKHSKFRGYWELFQRKQTI